MRVSCFPPSSLTCTEPQASATTNYVCFLLPFSTPRNATGVREPRSVTHQPFLKLRLSSWQPCEGGTIFVLQIGRASLWKIKQYAPIHVRTKRGRSELKCRNLWLQSLSTSHHGTFHPPPPRVPSSPTRAGTSLGLGVGMTLSEAWLAKREREQRTHFPLAYLCFHCCWYNSETRRK